MGILCFTDYFLPGYKAGGPIRTISNLVEQLGDEYDFAVVTRDRDLGDLKPYSHVKIDSWQKIEKAEVLYLSFKNYSLKALRRVISSKSHDILYLNSFFSPVFTIKPLILRRLKLIPDLPVILAPRGEFASGALAIKSLKKQAYFLLSKLIGLYQNVTWQASSTYDEINIRKMFGNHVPVIIAPNLPPLLIKSHDSVNCKKKIKGKLNIIFLGRISRVKNLDGAIKMLNGIKGEIYFNLFGPIEDCAYWHQCLTHIEKLPENIKVEYKGEVSHNHIQEIYKKHDLLFLPTLGENFGHTILEAFIAGCPVLISDRTPWRGLSEIGVGWDLPLNESAHFQEVIQRCVDMDEYMYGRLKGRAREYGLKKCRDQDVIDKHRKLFGFATRL